ncbi:MAG: WD40 repeat domain-containing protein [Microcoleus anatoxicus]|uniref:WD40 repeat domain-containing protein n=1 Tax=Microcoleus anatoxicus TaxID=2705319 RepID=UPI0036701D96
MSQAQLYRANIFLKQLLGLAAIGVLLQTIPQLAPVNWVSLSHNGQIIAVASDDGTVKLWSSDGRLIANLWHSENRKPSKVYTVSFSPDDETLASGGEDNTVKLWNVGPLQNNPQLNSIDKTDLLLTTLRGHSKWVFGVSFSPDGQTLASGGADRTVKIWSLVDIHGKHPLDATKFKPVGRLLRTFEGHADRVTQVSFSPDGKTLASASFDKTIRLWRLDDVPLKTLEGHQNRVLSVTFSPDGQRLASASMDKTIKLWSRTGVLLETLEGHTQRVSSLSFSPDGLLLASGSHDKTVKIWSLKEDGITNMLPCPSAPLFPCSPSVLLTLDGHSDSVTSVSFSPDGLLIASGSYDRKVKLWSRSGTLLKTLTGHKDSVMSVSFSPDGKVLASAGRDNRVILWNLDLDDLLVRGGDWVGDYLRTNPNVSDRDRHLCDGVAPKSQF